MSPRRYDLKNRVRAVLHDAAAEGFRARADALEGELRSLRGETQKAQAEQAASEARLQRIQQIVAAEFDGIPRLSHDLNLIRQSADYEEAFQSRGALGLCAHRDLQQPRDAHRSSHRVCLRPDL